MKIELSSVAGLTDKASQIKHQVQEYVDAYRLNLRADPDRILLRFDDYQALSRPIVRAALAAATESARAAFNAERARRKAAKWAEFKPKAPSIESMTLNGIPLICGPGYSRHRTVKAA